jgi:heme-degrading monooxygenase HmoA
MSQFELAQLNIAYLKAPIDSPILADFVANLDRINRLADAADGFRWRLQTDEGHAMSVRPFGDDVLINMSVWRDLEALRQFVYKPAHAEIMKRRREWFTQAPEAYAVLWWVPSGHRPSVSEAAERLQQLRSHGPSPTAFTFGRVFGTPDVDVPSMQEHLSLGTR